MPMGVYERKPWHRTYGRKELYRKIAQARAKGVSRADVAVKYNVSLTAVDEIAKNPENPSWNAWRNKKKATENA